MIFVWGKRPYGRIDAIDDSFIATTFVHVWFLPLLPVSSLLVVPASARGVESVLVPLVGRSVLAGYFRTWGVIGVGVSLIAWLDGDADALAPAIAPPVILVLAIAAVIAGWTVLARPSPEALRHRRVYAEQVGVAVDVGIIGAQRDTLRDRLRARLADEARSVAVATSYRAPASNGDDWVEVAQHPDVRDRAFLAVAMTLARLEWGAAKGERRRTLETAHRRIWDKLRGIGPSSG